MPEKLDQHAHRNLPVQEEPLDAAGQSLADALRASFRILKGIMMVLVVLYLFSNVRTLGSHEQALRLRLGKLLPGVNDPGLMWAFPYPIDEIVPLPTKKSNELMVDSHTFHRRPDEIGQPLAFISRPSHRGLHPTLDGALLTADTGLVHVQWKITYKIDDVSSYVSEVAGEQVEAAETLIRTFVENVGIFLATELTAEEIIRTRVDYVQGEMRRGVNEKLSAVNSGVTVTLVEMYEPTPPPQIREAFDRTQRAENSKQKRIRDAQQERTRVLSETAGSAYPRFIAILDDIDNSGDKGRSAEELRAELDRMLEHELEGEAGQIIRQAESYLSSVVGQMQSDVGLYRALLPEYERNPAMLIGRLWARAKQQIFSSPGVVKFYRPTGSQFRLQIPLDPEQERAAEERRLKQKKFDVNKLRPRRVVPVGPQPG